MTSSQMKQYVTALKMFFVLGVTWIVEVINYVLGWKYDHCWDSLSTLTVLFDIINAVQGITMFCAIVIDQERVTQAVQKLRHFSTTRTYTTNTNSQGMEQGKVVRNTKTCTELPSRNGISIKGCIFRPP